MGGPTNLKATLRLCVMSAKYNRELKWSVAIPYKPTPSSSEKSEFDRVGRSVEGDDIVFSGGNGGVAVK